MNLPSSVKALVKQFATAFPLPQGDPSEAGWDDTIRSWTVKLGSQVAFTLGPKWGLKRASSTRPIGKDSLAVQDGGELYSWDLLIGAGTGKPTLADEPTFYNLTGTEQVFESVPPHDYLAVGVQTGGTSPAPAAPPLNAVEFANAFAPVIDHAVAMLQGDIEAECSRIYAQNERIYTDLVARFEELKSILGSRSAINQGPLPSSPLSIPQIQMPADPPRVHITPEAAQTVASIVAGVVKILHR